MPKDIGANLNELLKAKARTLRVKKNKKEWYCFIAQIKINVYELSRQKRRPSCRGIANDLCRYLPLQEWEA